MRLPTKPMKRLIRIWLLMCAPVLADAQGTVNFANLFPNLVNPVVNAPVYESDRNTPLSGSQFMAELLGGPSTDALASIATAGFLIGAGAGYFNGGAQVIGTVPPGSTAWIQIRVWNTASGNSYPQAVASGLPNSWWQSAVFMVIAGGGFQGPPPTPLAGLGTSPVYLNGFVPEPSTLALASIGAALALFGVRRRRGLGLG